MIIEKNKLFDIDEDFIGFNGLGGGEEVEINKKLSEKKEWAVNILGYNCLISKNYTSEIEEIKDKIDKSHYDVCIMFGHDDDDWIGFWDFDLYSINSFNCIKIAKYFGGNAHPWPLNLIDGKKMYKARLKTNRFPIAFIETIKGLKKEGLKK